MDYAKLGLLLIEDFITIEEESALIKEFSLTSERQADVVRNNIKRYGSNYQESNFVATNPPENLDKLAKKAIEKKLIKNYPEQFVVNQYLPGQMIKPHIDRLDFGKIVTVFSLGTSATMVFAKGQQFKIELKPRSVVQIKDEIRNQWTHAIEPVKEERYSIVFRGNE